MSGRAAAAIAQFATKGSGLVAQLLTLALLTQALGAQGFGSYSLVLSTAGVAAQAADFGLGRYQFRLAHRGRPIPVLVLWSLGFRTGTTALLLPLLLLHGWRTEVPAAALALGFAANILFQLAGLNRHLLLLRERVTAAILLEAAPALFFCMAVALSLTAGTQLDVARALLLYLLATFGGLGLSIAAAGTAKSWARGAAMLLRARVRWVAAGVTLLARRSSLVGIEMLVAAATFNAPILIVASLGHTATPQVALYQRILGLEVALLSVTVTARFKRYYDSGSRRTLDLRPALVSGALVFALNAVALLLLGPAAAMLPQIGHLTLVQLALALRPQLIPIAAVTACVAAYSHCSIAALGGDWLWQRCLGGGIALGATVLGAAALSRAGLPPLAAVLQASLLGQALGIAVLVVTVARHGAHIHLPRPFSSIGARAA
ncbi:hypothetical protein [Sphingomonas desiccabilis]|uniref:hypothetical protein n=1 Tax=Sphingomonas desiccabilis TaxID=429134 RepID=UPI0013ECCF95|nr:hypothetical protein [Sphingomonas desiccabilis]MBB3911076.1 hypothetical protein [Sphingomonas desiccabilis]